MRILFVSNIFAPHVRGGYELGCQKIAERCVELGDDVAVATSAVTGKLERAAHSKLPHVEEIFDPVYEYEAEVYGRTVADPLRRSRTEAALGGILPQNAQALARFIESYAPELVWVFNPLALGTVGILEACLTSRAPCLLHLMDHVDDTVGQYQSEHYLLARYRRVKSCIHAIACSEKIAVSNTRLGEFASLRIIPNGVEFPEIPARQPTPASFVYFGQVERHKGVLEAVYGLHKLLERNSGCKASLDVIGSGSAAFRRDLEQEVERLGLRDAIRLRGFMPNSELMDVLGTYTAAILPLDEAEPFGYAPVEAAARGVPPIVTAQIGAAELFPAGYPLLLKDRRSADELAGHMQWCLDRPAAAREAAMQLRDSLRAQCDFKECAVPAYLRVAHALPQSPRPHDLKSLLASHHSCRLYRASLAVS